MDSIKKEVRKVLMAGLGAAAEGVERGDALLEKLAVKGEETLKQGKIKNEELKRTVRETFRGEKDAEEVMKAVGKMSAEELQALKEHIEKCEQAQAEKAEEAEEADASEEADAEDAPQENE